MPVPLLRDSDVVDNNFPTDDFSRCARLVRLVLFHLRFTFVSNLDEYKQIATFMNRTARRELNDQVLDFSRLLHRFCSPPTPDYASVYSRHATSVHKYQGIRGNRRTL